MAHHQRAVTIAVALNTGIFIVEAVAGYQASSLSLVMDSVHNLSDEMALIALWLAFIVARGPSKTLLRGANVFNSMGLLAVSAVLLWQAVERFLNPVPVNGVLPIVVGLCGRSRQLWRSSIVAWTRRAQRSDPAGLHSQPGRRLGFNRAGLGRTVASHHWLLIL
jgi:Co/Zn/Cd efflux system component